MMTRHPSEESLALLAGGECGAWSRLRVGRHVEQCEVCRGKVAEFTTLREELADFPEPEMNWNALAAEMRANIHLGLEAGECIRPAKLSHGWNPRLALAFASLLFVAGAGFVMTPRAVAPVQTATVLESSPSGLEVRSRGGSLTLLNRRGAVADQTVSAQGEIRARYIDGDAVTINNVYLE